MGGVFAIGEDDDVVREEEEFVAVVGEDGLDKEAPVLHLDFGRFGEVGLFVDGELRPVREIKIVDAA
jgi:hypothetical protein